MSHITARVADRTARRALVRPYPAFQPPANRRRVLPIVTLASTGGLL